MLPKCKTGNRTESTKGGERELRRGAKRAGTLCQLSLIDAVMPFSLSIVKLRSSAALNTARGFGLVFLRLKSSDWEREQRIAAGVPFEVHFRGLPWGGEEKQRLKTGLSIGWFGMMVGGQQES